MPATSPGWAGWLGDDGTVPTFTSDSVGRIGARLCPCSLAASTPQAFLVASPPATLSGFGVTAPPWWDDVHCCPAQIRQIRAGSRA